MKLQGRLIQVANITTAQRDEMFTLMETYYENMDRVVFETDLAEKHWVIHVVDPITGALCGFSTQLVLDVIVEDRPVRALFSGDTIVSRKYWGQNPLAQVWGRFALSLIDTSPASPANLANPSGELYWFLITQGYKTYRFLPVFFHEFYPRYGVPTPAWATALMSTLGQDKYGAAYAADIGIVPTPQLGYRLRSGIAEITAQRLQDPHVRFFAERNPGHARGDELCCIAPLTRENFTPAAYRVIGSTPEVSALPA